MRLYCPQCSKKYDDVSFDTCPDDGARLYSLSEKREDPLLGTILGERFRIEQLLSKGGMGAVYRATQLSVNREVALKVLRPDLEQEELFLERFFREAQVVADLSHPNIVRLIDFGQDRRTELLFLVMELVKGTDMGELLESGRLDPAMALDVVYQVCAGLTEPHSRGIVHRDLKPENIILLPISDGTFQVKLLDFGIARTAETGTQLTQTGMICGTPSYMSPEQAKNEPVDPRTDLYSLGVVLFEMLTGHLPFQANSGLQLLMNHVQRPPPNLAEAYPGMLPKEVCDLVADLLEKAPDDRPRSAMAVRRRVQQIREDLKLPPVFLSEDASGKIGPDAEKEALFGPWLLPDLDPDMAADSSTPIDPAMGGLPPGFGEPEQGDTSDSDDSDGDSSDSIEFAKTASFDTPTATPEPEYPEKSDGERHEAAKPATATAATPAIGKGPLLLMGSGMIAILALLVFVVATLLSSDGAEEDPVSDDSAAVAEADERGVGELADPDERHTLIQHDDEGRDGDDDGADGDATGEAGQPTEEGPEVASLRTRLGTQSAGTTAPTPPSVDVPQVDTSPTRPTSVDPPTTDAPDLEPPAPGQKVYQGSIHLESPSQVPAAAGYEEITGDLIVRINVDDFTHLELPDLKKLGGNLILDTLSKVVNVSLPSLETVGGNLMSTQSQRLGNLNAPNLRTIGMNLILTASQISSFTLPRLTRIEGMLTIMNNTDLGTVGLPALEHIGGAFTMMENPKLEVLTTTELTHVDEDLIILSPQISTVIMDRLETVGGGITLNENTSLEVLRMSRLSTVGMSSSRGAGITINEAPKLDELRLTNLRRVNTNLLISSAPKLTRINLGNLEEVGSQITFTNNDSVESIDLSALTTVGGNLVINNHDSLRRLTANRLQDIDDLIVVGNPRLSTCELQSMTNRMESSGWDGDARFANNLDDQC